MRMPFNIRDCLGHVLVRTRLEEIMAEVGISDKKMLDVLAQINHLQFVTAALGDFVLLRAHRDPIESLLHEAVAVCFDRRPPASIVERVPKRPDFLKGRFATGEDDPLHRPHSLTLGFQILEELRKRTLRKGDVVFGIAKGTGAIAARKAQEDRGHPGIESFALEAVKDFVNFQHNGTRHYRFPTASKRRARAKEFSHGKKGRALDFRLSGFLFQE